MTAWMQLGGMRGGAARLRAIARVLVETNNAVLHSALTLKQDESEPVREELKILLVSYLENYVEDET